MKQQTIKNVIDSAFGGKTVTLITCQTCKNTNVRKQDITHLAVEVKGMPSLKHSLDKFTESQEITDYQCDQCNKKGLGSIQKLIYKLPDTLIINLLRITFDIHTFEKVKIHSRHEFPDKLDLKNYLYKEAESPLEE